MLYVCPTKNSYDVTKKNTRPLPLFLNSGKKVEVLKKMMQYGVMLHKRV